MSKINCGGRHPTISGTRYPRFGHETLTVTKEGTSRLAFEMQTEGVLQLPQSAIFAKTCTVHDKSRMLIVSVERNSRYGKAQDSAPNLRCHDISDLDPEAGLSQLPTRSANLRVG